MNYILVATESRVGNITITGPITGKHWVVTPKGSWIADEFERDDKVLHLDLKRFCKKQNRFIPTKIFLIEPSYKQMESIPIGG